MSNQTLEKRKEVARRLRDYAGENAKWIAPWAVFNDGSMTDQELKNFNQGFLCAMVCAYESCYLDANSALEFLHYIGGFKTLDECLAYEPNEDEAEALKALFETAKGDGKLKAMPMTSDLKPCPFCGASAHRVKHSGRWEWFVSCGRCSMEGPHAITKELAHECWNVLAEQKQQQLFDGKMKMDATSDE